MQPCLAVASEFLKWADTFISLFPSSLFILFKHLDLFVGAEIRGGEKLTEVFPVLTHGSQGRSSSGFFLVASSFAPAAVPVASALVS